MVIGDGKERREIEGWREGGRDGERASVAKPANRFERKRMAEAYNKMIKQSQCDQLE